MVIGLNTKAWYTFKIRELSMDWRTPVPPIHIKVAYYSFYEARARATIRLPDVNIARARKTFVSNTKGNENKFEPFFRKLTVS